jgi:hypothetical protein
MTATSVTYSTALVIAIVCIIIGFAAGGFIGVASRNRRKKKEDEAETNNIVAPSAPPLADPAKYTELLRLWREKETSRIFVETSGHLLASSEPLNERQKNRFIDLLKELADWLNIPAATISEKVVNPLPAVEETRVVPQAASFETAAAQAEIQSTEPVKKASDPIKTAPIPPPYPTNSTGIVQPVQPQTAPPVPAYNPLPKAPPKPVVDATKTGKGTMVEQIDAILQEVIENSDKPDRKIRLVEELKEGVIVWVGHDHYVGIDAVPDPIVKDLIRIAVKEWDRRTENHL